MRLDKFLRITGTATRTEAARAVRAGQVSVNGRAATCADMPIDPERDTVTLNGEPVDYRPKRYLLLNKPAGYVSATTDGREHTVLELLPPLYQVLGVFPCGRLDKDTLGLMILTNDGELAHRLLSPRRHVEKDYLFRTKFALNEEQCARFAEGLTLADGYETKPAHIELSADAHSGRITLIEGKYHQIKRMMGALENKLIALERVRFGPIALPPDLPRGSFRELTDTEVQALRTAAGMTA